MIWFSEDLPIVCGRVPPMDLLDQSMHHASLHGHDSLPFQGSDDLWINGIQALNQVLVVHPALHYHRIQVVDYEGLRSTMVGPMDRTLPRQEEDSQMWTQEEVVLGVHRFHCFLVVHSLLEDREEEEEGLPKHHSILSVESWHRLVHVPFWELASQAVQSIHLVGVDQVVGADRTIRMEGEEEEEACSDRCPLIRMGLVREEGVEGEPRLPLCNRIDRDAIRLN